jgi:hypothetical protein
MSMNTYRVAIRKTVASVAAACAMGLLLGGCASDARWGQNQPPHPGAANPWSNGGFSDPGPNYPATGH